MSGSVFLDWADQYMTERIHKKARQKERALPSDAFVAYYVRQSVARWFVFFALFVLCTVLLGWLDRWVLVFLVVFTVLSFLVFLYHATYRCYVDGAGMTVVRFWILKKRILWKDVHKVEVQEFQPYGKPLEKTSSCEINKIKSFIHALMIWSDFT